MRCEHGVRTENECVDCDGPSIIEDLRAQLKKARDIVEAAHFACDKGSCSACHALDDFAAGGKP